MNDPTPPLVSADPNCTPWVVQMEREARAADVTGAGRDVLVRYVELLRRRVDDLEAVLRRCALDPRQTAALDLDGMSYERALRRMLELEHRVQAAVDALGGR